MLCDFIVKEFTILNISNISKLYWKFERKGKKRNLEIFRLLCLFHSSRENFFPEFKTSFYVQFHDSL